MESEEEFLIKVYIHPLHYHSYELVKALSEMGMLDSISLIDSSMIGPNSLLKAGIWSLPWIALGEIPVATYPYSLDDVIAIISSRGQQELVRLELGKKPLDAFIETLANSVLASVLVFIHGSLYPVLDTSLAMAATRSVFTGIDPHQVLDEVRARERELYEEVFESIVRMVAVSFTRDVLLSDYEKIDVFDRRELYKVFRLWLLAKASIGDIGFPYYLDKSDLDKREKTLFEYLESNLERIIRKIERENNKIAKDDEYRKIIAAYTR